MKLEATLTAIAALITVWFVITRDAYAMGAMVFVATPLFVVSIAFYLRRVFSDLSDRNLL